MDRLQSAPSWVYSLPHRQRCRVVDVQTLWGETLYRVWVPTDDIMVTLRSDQVAPPRDDHEEGLLTTDQVAYLVAAARVADTLAQERDVLLATLEAAVTPLPHQLQTLTRAMAGDHVRYLLADEVGLGKTIEADLTSSRPLNTLVQSPTLFPFSLARPHWSDLTTTGELEVVRQGRDDDIVMLCGHTR